MELPVAKKELLNSVSHSVRAAQAVLQYGVGAMVDFPDQTLMTAAPEYWKEQVVQIHDERLERALRVNYFGLPAGKEDAPEGISYVRFPEWYFCPKCRRFQPLKDWIKAYRKKPGRAEKDPNMIKSPKCPYCNPGQELVVARIITVCGQYGFKCEGKHPWKHTKELCSRYPKVLQRGSSSVYFPVTESSLVIPPYSSQINQKVESSKGFEKCKEVISRYKKSSAIPKALLPTLIEEQIKSSSNDISLEKSIESKKVYDILERKWMSTDPEDEYTTTSVKYRAEEYEALNGEVSFPTGDGGDFVREATDISAYKIPYIKSISLIHKVREVQALIGFSRLNPIEPAVSKENAERLVSVTQPETDWYPAYEVRGEGIFIEFDNDAISEWSKAHPEV